MFSKAYKLKSNNTLKNSEKKHLVQRIQNEFPEATDEKAKELVPLKHNSSYMKLILHSNETIGVYLVEGIPIMIDTEGGLVPTVCALWKVPDLIPTLVIHSPVLSKVLGGAPLYLPGIVLPAGGAGFPRFPRGAALAACTHDNASAALVGRATLSSGDMLLRASGVCMDILHVYGDLLCKDPKFAKIERPKSGVATYGHEFSDITANISQKAISDGLDVYVDLTPTGRAPFRKWFLSFHFHQSSSTMSETVLLFSLDLSIQSTVKEEWPSLGKRNPSPAPAPPAPAPAPLPAPAPTPPPAPAPAPAHSEPPHSPHSPPAGDDSQLENCVDIDSSQTEEGNIPTDMDGLLQWCLLSFLKLEGKRIELPLKTNLLYRNHLIPLCPPDRTLDVKKSTYKKMSKFLDAMQKEGLVEVREIEKGVDAVVAVSAAHERVRAHAAPAPAPAPRAAPAAPAARAAPAGPQYAPPLVRELFCVTADVADVLAPYKKGTALTSAEVRSALTEYVKSRGLQARGRVALDAALARAAAHAHAAHAHAHAAPAPAAAHTAAAPTPATDTQELIKWDTLMSAVQNKMTSCTEMRFSDGSVKLTKSKLEPIKMQVASRSGNKKVTLVSNLESFGFNLLDLSRLCQHAVAASCGVTRTPGAKHDQLMLQGDQTHFVAKLLIEKYGLPKKYVEGADKALKKKK